MHFLNYFSFFDIIIKVYHLPIFTLQTLPYSLPSISWPPFSLIAIYTYVYPNIFLNTYIQSVQSVNSSFLLYFTLLHFSVLWVYCYCCCYSNKWMWLACTVYWHPFSNSIYILYIPSLHPVFIGSYFKLFRYYICCTDLLLMMLWCCYFNCLGRHNELCSYKMVTKIHKCFMLWIISLTSHSHISPSPQVPKAQQH